MLKLLNLYVAIWNSAWNDQTHVSNHKSKWNSTVCIADAQLKQNDIEFPFINVNWYNISIQKHDHQNCASDVKTIIFTTLEPYLYISIYHIYLNLQVKNLSYNKYKK